MGPYHRVGSSYFFSFILSSQAHFSLELLLSSLIIEGCLDSFLYFPLPKFSHSLPFHLLLVLPNFSLAFQLFQQSPLL